MDKQKEILSFLEKEIFSSENDVKSDAEIDINELDHLISGDTSNFINAKSENSKDSYEDGFLLDVHDNSNNNTTTSKNDAPFLDDEVDDIINEISENHENLEATEGLDDLGDALSEPSFSELGELTDSPETPEPSNDDFFSDNANNNKEDEDITLSGDELDDIVENVTEVQEEPIDLSEIAESPFSSELGELTGSPEISEPSSDDFFSDDANNNKEDEDITLSGDELDNIVENVTEVQEEPTSLSEIAASPSETMNANDDISTLESDTSLDDLGDTLSEPFSSELGELTGSPETSEPSSDNFFSDDANNNKEDEDIICVI